MRHPGAADTASATAAAAALPCGNSAPPGGESFGAATIAHASGEQSRRTWQQRNGHINKNTSNVRNSHATSRRGSHPQGCPRPTSRPASRQRPSRRAPATVATSACAVTIEVDNNVGLDGLTGIGRDCLKCRYDVAPYTCCQRQGAACRRSDKGSVSVVG